jgi:hypothetical protein
VTTLALATCSFAAYTERMGAGVRITLGVPRWPPPPGGRMRWPYLAEASPRGWYYKAAPEKFTACYLSQLHRFAADIDRKLIWLADRYPGQTLIACCFERRVGPHDCHRLDFGRWYEERTGQPVPELDPRERNRS